MQSCENMYNGENYCGIIYFNTQLVPKKQKFENISQ